MKFSSLLYNCCFHSYIPTGTHRRLHDDLFLENAQSKLVQQWRHIQKILKAPQATVDIWWRAASLAAGALAAAGRSGAVHQPQGGLGWRLPAVTEVEAEASLQVLAAVMVGLITEATQQQTRAKKKNTTNWVKGKSKTYFWTTFNEVSLILLCKRGYLDTEML